jgi:hypothetical protein
MDMTDRTMLIHRYFELASQPDAHYFAQFAEDAVVEDEGVQRTGIEAIRTWRTEVPPVVYSVDDIAVADPGHDAHVNVAGDFPGSPVRLTFHFEFTANDHIAVLNIHP